LEEVVTWKDLVLNLILGVSTSISRNTLIVESCDYSEQEKIPSIEPFNPENQNKEEPEKNIENNIKQEKKLEPIKE
jgi:hypothetical protein